MRLLLILAVVAHCQENDYRGIIHCHSYLSHDSKGTFEEITAAAKKTKTDFIAMSDHPKGDNLSKIPDGVVNGVLIIPGSETNNLVSVGVTKAPAGKTLTERIADTVKKGGVPILCHPEEIESPGDFSAAGMEIYNLHSDTKDEDRLLLLAKASKFLKDDPDKVYLSFFNFPLDFLRKYDETRGFCAVAGNDAHQNIKIGSVQLDPYERSFRFVSTHVIAPELSRDAVLTALKAGKTYVAFELYDYATGFQFSITSGSARAAFGGSVKLDKTAKLELKLPKRAVIRIMRDGSEVGMYLDSSVGVEVRTAGYYRVEVYAEQSDEILPWIYSGSISLGR